MATWSEIYQSYVDLPKSRLEEIASEEAAKVLNWMFGRFGKEDAPYAFISTIGVFVCADGTVNTAEYELFIKITGLNLTYDDFYEYVKNCVQAAVVNDLDKVTDSAPEYVKLAILSLGLCFCAINETITVAEKKVIELLAA